MCVHFKWIIFIDYVTVDFILSVAKGWLAWKRYLAMKRSALILQKHFRRFLIRKERLVALTPHVSTETLVPSAEQISLPCHVPLLTNAFSQPRPSWFAPFEPRSYGSLLMNKPQVIEHNMEINNIHRSSGIASRRRIEHVSLTFVVLQLTEVNA